MTSEQRPRRAKRNTSGRPTTVTIYLSAAEEEALSDRAKSAKQSVPAFIAGMLRERLSTGQVEEQ